MVCISCICMATSCSKGWLVVVVVVVVVVVGVATSVHHLIEEIELERSEQR